MPHAAHEHGPHPLHTPCAARTFVALIYLFCASNAGVASGAGTLSVTATQRGGLPATGAVILIQALDQSLTAPPVQGVLDQVDLAFVPDVLVIPVNSSVHFPNSDAVSHQVYSFSSAKSFQLPLYRGKPYPPVVFDRPGVVSIGCNIHDAMLAYVIVTDAPYFGRTDARGTFQVDSLPAGRYRISLWHPRLSEPQVEQTVEMGAADLRIELQLRRNMRPAPLGGKPRSWDY